jgi:hypothetical protein
LHRKGFVLTGNNFVQQLQYTLWLRAFVAKNNFINRLSVFVPLWRKIISSNKEQILPQANAVSFLTTLHYKGFVLTGNNFVQQLQYTFCLRAFVAKNNFINRLSVFVPSWRKITS